MLLPHVAPAVEAHCQKHGQQTTNTGAAGGEAHADWELGGDDLSFKRNLSIKALIHAGPPPPAGDSGQSLVLYTTEKLYCP
jgi:hypothetical protein